MRRALERYAQKLWYEGLPGRGWTALSFLYAKALGDRWQRPQEKPPCPVIVVGNLSAGGTGKTPVTMALAEHLQQAGFRPAIISRGYGGRVGGGPEQVGRDADPRHFGDEPVLMASHIQVPVWVGSRRRLALEAAYAAGADVVISDDGLQHADLPRSHEIVVIDGARGFGNGHLLPAGPLRCPPQRLEQADAVLLRAPCTAADLPPGQMFELKALGLRDLDGGALRTPDCLAGQPVTAVCGIGNPEQFAAKVAELGMQVDLRRFPDHHRYQSEDLAGLSRPIVTTAKDAIKLKRLDPVPQGVYVLEVAAELPPVLLQGVAEHVRKFKP